MKKQKKTSYDYKYGPSYDPTLEKYEGEVSSWWILFWLLIILGLLTIFTS